MSAKERLQSLMRFDDCTSSKLITSRFQELASTLMGNFCVVRETETFCMTSLELYLYTSLSTLHQDPYTDRNPIQFSNGSWYVYLKGVKWSRLDITLGSEAQKLYGSLLIRAIDGVDGSAKSLRTIVRSGATEVAPPWAWSEREKTFLNSIHNKNIWDSALRLSEKPESSDARIKLLPRVFTRPKGSPFDHVHLRAVLD